MWLWLYNMSMNMANKGAQTMNIYQQQWHQYLHKWHVEEATMDTCGWNGWYVINGIGTTKIFTKDKTKASAQSIADKKNREQGIA